MASRDDCVGPENGPLQISEGGRKRARTQFHWKEPELHKHNSQTAGSVAFLPVVPSCRGQCRDPYPRGPSHMSFTPWLLSPFCSNPSSFFNCWMSLQSCVPKTINSREQSYTKKGVSPEGDGYPWKPLPFYGGLGEALMRWTGWGLGVILYPAEDPRKGWGP